MTHAIAEAAAAHRSVARRISSLLRVVVTEHGPIFIIMALHVGLGRLATATGLGRVLTTSPIRWGEFVDLFRLVLYWLPVLLMIELWRRRRPRAALQAFAHKYLNARSLLGVLIGSVFVATEARTHALWKQTLGRETPFTWDRRFAELDRLLHGGVDPWRLLDPILSAPAITVGMDVAYWFWLPLTAALGALVIWLPDRPLRTRILTAWALIWVLLGTVAAHLWPSAGPVYYGELVPGPNPYGDLLAHLKAVHANKDLFAVILHGVLRENVAAGNLNPWFSISAMPSMHIALTAFATVVTWRLSRPLSVALAGYTLVILAGSVYLGWHYAVDGYAAILGALAIWYCTGKMSRFAAQ